MKMFTRRVGQAIGLVALLFALSTGARTEAQEYSSFTAGSAQGSFLFQINGTQVTSKNYSDLVGIGGKYTFGFDGTYNPFTITFADKSYMDVYGIRGVYLVNKGGVSGNLDGNDITGYKDDPTSTSATTQSWDKEKEDGTLGYMIDQTGFPGSNKEGSNWLAYQPSNDSSVDIAGTDWTGKAQYGTFAFTSLKGIVGLQIGLDVYGDRYLADGSLDKEWAAAGGTGRVRLTDVAPDPGPGDTGGGSLIVPEGSSLPMILLGLVPVCGFLMYRRQYIVS